MLATEGDLKSFFERTIEKAGLKVEEDSFTLAVEQSLFRRNIQLEILKANAKNNIVEEFIQQFEVFVDDLNTLKLCLQPTAIAGSIKGTYTTDSLVRILLSIDSVQPDLLDLLLEKLTHFISAGDDAELESFPKSILHQLRWLDHIVEPERLTAKIMEIISITPIEIQRELIVNLPEIVNDSEHKVVVAELQTLMEENANLMAPILDALSNLNLQKELLDNIREPIIDRLESADLDDLPIMIKFLLQSVDADNAQYVIGRIRSKLDLKSIYRLRDDKLFSQSTSSKAAQKTKKIPETLILESLRSGLQFNKMLRDVWLKVIGEVGDEQDHQLLDFIILIIMHSLKNIKKKAESIFRKKISSGVFSLSLLEETIINHHEALREYFGSLLSLAEAQLRACQNNMILGRAASVIYEACFRTFDSYYRQEVIGSLVTHIGSGASWEIDTALDCLLNIVTTCAKEAVPFSIFIKGILDYLDNLSITQIRVLFSIFSALASEGQKKGEDGILNDLNIVIRKQLSSSIEKYRQMGVVGALAIVKKIGSKDSVALRAGSSRIDDEVHMSQALKNPQLRQAIAVIEMTMESCKKSSSSLALAYDELSNIIESNMLDPRLTYWINENIACNFADVFLCEKLRELLNAFSDQKDEEMLGKCLIRLSHIEALEHELESILSYMPKISPSLHLLDLPETQEGNGATRSTQNKEITIQAPKKRVTEKAGSDREDDSTSVKASHTTQVTGTLPYFRELEMSVFKLLRCEQLKATHDPDVSPHEKSTLTYSDLRFLIKDLKEKLAFKLGQTTPSPFGRLKKKDNGSRFQMLARKGPQEVMSEVNEILPYLCRHLENAAQEIQVLGTDGDTTSERIEVECIDIILNTLIIIFSWSDLSSPDNEPILSKTLNNLASRIKLSTESPTNQLQELVQEAFEYVYKFSDLFQTASLSILLHKLLGKIMELAPQVQLLSPEIGKFSEKLLGCQWSDIHAIKSDDLGYLLRQRILHSEDPLGTIEEYASVILPGLFSGDVDLLEDHPLLTRETFLTFYKTVNNELINVVGQFQDRLEEQDALICHISKIVISWQNLVGFAKNCEKRPLLTLVLKNGRTFIELFLKKIMPCLDVNFRTYRNEILSIFKKIQNATRILQNVCSHSKVTKDLVLTANVPLTRKALETLFITGEEVSSQIPQDEIQDQESEAYGSSSHAPLKSAKIRRKRKAPPTHSNSNLDADEESNKHTRTEVPPEHRKLSNSQISNSDVEEETAEQYLNLEAIEDEMEEEDEEEEEEEEAQDSDGSILI
ncbi:hypothetical protein K493DRAFT_356944 [Basidiobolus meristosporus CBS 931.73]|uniref:Fanconi anemia group D2 protein n=1 Tax=Basidiobolus meristosporus CBS 931.73 TaxID=1314790 RepID=A0A1Y1XX46_9FUNG|nr:hypothetical protein K493DRAFT_356944 [Basidiobolus meristosporus CBS 931.73]|eukprot:ORX90317.1 hypothetical protein K493DRAFT_356944 [Basidiobolus meristosporus CBS 931.73]